MKHQVEVQSTPFASQTQHVIPLGNSGIAHRIGVVGIDNVIVVLVYILNIAWRHVPKLGYRKAWFELAIGIEVALLVQTVGHEHNRLPHAIPLLVEVRFGPEVFALLGYLTFGIPQTCLGIIGKLVFQGFLVSGRELEAVVFYASDVGHGQNATPGCTNKPRNTRIRTSENARLHLVENIGRERKAIEKLGIEANVEDSLVFPTHVGIGQGGFAEATRAVGGSAKQVATIIIVGGIEDVAGRGLVVSYLTIRCAQLHIVGPSGIAHKVFVTYYPCNRSRRKEPEAMFG